ncbi:MAG: hypothetical protein AB4062_01295, partial [Crocosphaera sp.]
MLNELEKSEISCINLVLQPLQKSHINRMLTDTLKSNINQVSSLSKLILSKTHGNPFFVKEFVKTIHQKQLISFDFKQQQWSWNIQQIEAENITDNVVELMVIKLNNLSVVSQKILSLAACLGSEFELKTVAIVAKKSSQEIFEEMTEAISLGLIIPTSELDEQLLYQDYKFLHDRVQQAAYSLIELSQKSAVNLQVARLLWQNLEASDLNNKIFTIVDRYNLGKDLISDPEEKQKLIQLNLQVAIKAKDSAAYQTAFKYLQIAISLSEFNSWHEHYKTTLEIYTEAAELTYIINDYQQSLIFSEIILKNAINSLDKVRTYQNKIAIYSAQNKLQLAIDSALESLNLLGVSLIQEPPDKFDIDTIDHLPKMIDPSKEAAIKIFLSIFGPIYQHYPKLFFSANYTMLDLFINYGNSPDSPYTYMWYAILLCAKNKIQTGYKLGKRIIQLSQKGKIDNHQLVKIINVFYLSVSPLNQHYQKSLEPLKNNIQLCLELGKAEIASYSIVNYSNLSFF